MGACTFQERARGKSIHEAYREAVREAREEYGNDAYNGTISTTNGVIDVTSEFKRSGLSLGEFINKNIDRAEKRGHCLGICVKEAKENSNKIKSKVEHNVEKGTKKWVLKYVVYDPREDRQIASEKTKGDAVKKARKYTEETQRRTFIAMEKVLEKGNSTVATITYKGSSNETIGEYVLFGWAAE